MTRSLTIVSLAAILAAPAAEARSAQMPAKPQPSTTWVALPDLYTARCVRAGARSWLLITRIQHAGDPRPSAQPILSPSMGLHAADINIALGALITLVRSETAAYLAHH